MRRSLWQNETSQTQRVLGRSPEQPSPKCCSIANLLLALFGGNGTNGPCLWISCHPPSCSPTSVGARNKSLRSGTPALGALSHAKASAWKKLLPVLDFSAAGLAGSGAAP